MLKYLKIIVEICESVGIRIDFQTITKNITETVRLKCIFKMKQHYLAVIWKWLINSEIE